MDRYIVAFGGPVRKAERYYQTERHENDLTYVDGRDFHWVAE